MDKLKSKELVIVAGDTLPPQMEALKAGRSHVQVGQRPFEMGYRAPTVMIDLIGGQEGGRSGVHRPRRVHARERGQLPGEVEIKFPPERARSDAVTPADLRARLRRADDA